MMSIVNCNPFESKNYKWTNWQIHNTHVEVIIQFKELIKWEKIISVMIRYVIIFYDYNLSGMVGWD